MREARVRRILSALLLLYPHSFRCMLGEDLLETTIRRWRDSTLAFWWIELPRFVLDGVLERLRTAPSFVAERTDRRAPMTVLLAATPLADLAIGVKMLRSPREMPAMVVALSIGVGLTVAAYSLIHAVLLAPLPYREPEALVRIWDVDEPSYVNMQVLNNKRREALAASPSPFRAIASFGFLDQSFRAGATSPAVLAGAHVSSNLFDVLGVRAAAGRTLEADDRRATHIPPIVVSERLVRSGVVSGRLDEIVHLDGVAYRVIGIMPAAFWFPDRRTTYWVSFSQTDDDQPDDDDGSAVFAAIARLAGGVTPAAAEGHAYTRLSSAGEPAARRRVRVESYAAMLTAAVRPSLVVLQAASALVLLLVCLNLAWLFTARARRLRQTFVTMRALGATRGRVVTTYLMSAWFVAGVTAPCALLVAWLLLRFGLTLESGVFSRIAEPAMTWHVVVVGWIATTLASLGSSVPGAWAVGRWAGPLIDTSRTSTRRRLFERSGMAVQLGLVFAVGVQATIFALILQTTSRTNVGFQKTDFVVVELQPRSGVAVDASAQLARYNFLLERFERRGIRAAAANIFPFTGSDHRSTFFEKRRSREHQRAMVRIRVVTPSYFQVTGMTATSGRLLTGADVGSRHIVVTDAFAASVLRRPDVIGERAGINGEYVIVGVTPPIRQHDFNEDAVPEAYVLYDDRVATRAEAASRDFQRTYIVAESRLGTATTLAAIRDGVASQMPDVEVRSASHMKDLINVGLGVKRLVAAGSVLFALVALLLAGVGFYGMISHGLALRDREIGVRMALGATPGRIAEESVRPVAVVYAIGILVGTALLVFSKAAILSVMVPPPGVAYPSLFAVGMVAAAVLLGALAAACYRPVRAAAITDPAVSLRVE